MRPPSRPQRLDRSRHRRRQRNGPSSHSPGERIVAINTQPDVSVALHPPGRDLEQPPDRLRREGRHLPIQGLPPRRRGPAAGHDACGRRVHPPLPDARVAARIPPHPPLRPAGRLSPQGQCRARPQTPGCHRAAPDDDTPGEPDDYHPPCPCCGGRRMVIETFERRRQPRGPPDASSTNRENDP